MRNPEFGAVPCGATGVQTMRRPAGCDQPGRLRLAKLIRADGSIEPFDDARTFNLFQQPIVDIDYLYGLSRELLERPDLALVRGAIVDPARTHKVRKLLLTDPRTGDVPTLKAAARRWVSLDIDAIPLPANIDARDIHACGAEAIKHLPPEFRDVRAVCAATAKHGLLAQLRLRLSFWLDRAVSDEELQRWLAPYPVDLRLFHPVQLHFTAAPVFEAGRSDHLPSRITILAGARDVVTTPSAEALAPTVSPTASHPPAARVPAHRPSPQHQTPASNAERMIEHALDRVRHARDGEKHTTLFKASYWIGGLIDRAGISEADAVARLLDTLVGRQLDDWTKTKRTAEDGIALGRQRPFEPAVRAPPFQSQNRQEDVPRTRKPLPAPGSPGAANYAVGAMRHAINRVATSTAAQCHATLTAQARDLDRFARAGLLPEHDVRRALLGAVGLNGSMSDEDAVRAYEWATGR